MIRNGEKIVCARKELRTKLKRDMESKKLREITLNGADRADRQRVAAEMQIALRALIRISRVGKRECGGIEPEEG